MPWLWCNVMLIHKFVQTNVEWYNNDEAGIGEEPKSVLLLLQPDTMQQINDAFIQIRAMAIQVGENAGRNSE